VSVCRAAAAPSTGVAYSREGAYSVVPLAGDDAVISDGATISRLDARGQVVARVARAGLETLVVDQTRPDLGLCAVKVVVPGLRHFWPRFAPGRLYDVPERLGWTRALAEADLNPVPLFL
jgi:ribosomal protein S12 methylthiotransferase accessory factor